MGLLVDMRPSDITPFEQLILDTADFCDSLKLPFILDGSNLLGAVRDGRAIKWDKEVNFSVDIDDINEDILTKCKEHKKFHQLNQSNIHPSAIYMFDNQNMWDSVPGVVLLSVFSRKNKKCYFNLCDDYCHVYPLEFGDKTKWEKLEFLGRDFNVPPNHKEMLRIYYGNDYMTPIEGWRWTQAGNLSTYAKI